MRWWKHVCTNSFGFFDELFINFHLILFERHCFLVSVFLISTFCFENLLMKDCYLIMFFNREKKFDDLIIEKNLNNQKIYLLLRIPKTLFSNRSKSQSFHEFSSLCITIFSERKGVFYIFGFFVQWIIEWMKEWINEWIRTISHSSEASHVVTVKIAMIQRNCNLFKFFIFAYLEV